MKGFITFIREQSIVGLAIGFILGGSINKVVSSFVNDIIQPLIGMIFGSTEGLSALQYGSIRYGSFISSSIDFLIIALIVYFIFRKFRLETLDIKKQPAPEYKK